MVECLLSVHKAMGSIPSTAKEIMFLTHALGEGHMPWGEDHACPGEGGKGHIQAAATTFFVGTTVEQ